MTWPSLQFTTSGWPHRVSRGEAGTGPPSMSVLLRAGRCRPPTQTAIRLGRRSAAAAERRLGACHDHPDRARAAEPRPDLRSTELFERAHPQGFSSGLTLKNRVLRSSISGRFDNYDGSGTVARVNWEEQFARGGVGAVISSHVPIQVRGRVLPNYAVIDDDDKIPFWRVVGERVHEHGCAYILQLSYSGRQRDIAGVENAGNMALSATSKPDPVHGLPAQAMTKRQIDEVVTMFGHGARRAREAGLDGVELHACNGYLFTQFLSSAINDRTDEYGGPLENRARFLLEAMAAIRREAGADFYLQVKLSAVEHADALIPWSKKGNTLAESVQVLRWAEEAGAHAVHVSTGSSFPHPLNPAGDFRPGDLFQTYDTMLSSGGQHVAELCAVALSADAPAGPLRLDPHRAAEPRGAAAFRRRGGTPAPDGPGHRDRRLPDRLGGARGDRRRPVRRGQHRPPVDRQPRSGRTVGRRGGPAAAAVQLLQPAPVPRPQRPPRLLRRAPLRRRPRPDDRAGHVGLPPGRLVR